MLHYLIAHCPTNGCNTRIPISRVPMEERPEFDPTLYVVLICPNCQQEFRELASLLDWCPTAKPAETT